MELQNSAGLVVATVEPTPRGGFWVRRLQRRGGDFVNLGNTYTQAQVEQFAIWLKTFSAVPDWKEWSQFERKVSSQKSA